MEEQQSGPGPLAGIRVIDLTTVILGPYATQQLADLGADVIKVEPPAGDNMRFAAPMRTHGMGHIFMQLNRNKRGIVLDLKQPDGARCGAPARGGRRRARPQRPPAAMARLGLAYDDVRAVNERSSTSARRVPAGGPLRREAAYDDIIQGLIALPSLIGDQTSAGRRATCPRRSATA